MTRQHLPSSVRNKSGGRSSASRCQFKTSCSSRCCRSGCKSSFWLTVLHVGKGRIRSGGSPAARRNRLVLDALGHGWGSWLEAVGNASRVDRRRCAADQTGAGWAIGESYGASGRAGAASRSIRPAKGEIASSGSPAFQNSTPGACQTASFRPRPA